MDREKLGRAIKGLIPSIFGLTLSSGTKRKYKSEFSVLRDAASAGGFDQWSASEEDLCFASLFYVLGRSVRSLPGFLSACSKVYESSGLSLPRGPRLEAFTSGLERLYYSIDEVEKAYCFSKKEMSKILSNISHSSFLGALFACWLLFSWLGALRPSDSKKTRLRWSDLALGEDGVDFSIRPNKGKKHHGVARFSVPSVPGSFFDLSYWLRRLQSFLPADWPPSRAVFARRLPPHKAYSGAWFVGRLRKTYKLLFPGSPPEKITAYSMRRGSATAMYRAGADMADVSAFLRHKNIDVTLRYIATLESRDRRREFARYAM